MDAIFLQVLNGLDKGGAYALIALGLTLVFGTLGVVNFAHGALFMLGAFCAVWVNRLLAYPIAGEKAEGELFAPPAEPFAEVYFGEFGTWMLDYSIPISILVAVPIMALVGIVFERGLIRHFYKRPHADQILVTFGLAIVIGELVKHQFGAGQQPVPKPDALLQVAYVGQWIGLGDNVVYPWWRLIYLAFSLTVISAVFAFLHFTTFGMVVRAGMQDREMVGLLGINIQKRFTIVFAIASIVAGLAGLMYVGVQPPEYLWAMDFLVISFVVVVVGGMGSLGGAVLAGFLLGILQSLAALNVIQEAIPGISQIIIYLVAVIVLLTLPRGLMGRKGVMED